MLKPITQHNVKGLDGKEGDCSVEVIHVYQPVDEGWFTFCYYKGRMLGCGPSGVSKQKAVDFAEQFLKDAAVPDCEFLNLESAKKFDVDLVLGMRAVHLSPEEMADYIRSLRESLSLADLDKKMKLELKAQRSALIRPAM